MRAPQPIPFASSERSTLGLEWELALVDRASGELAPHAPAILPALRHLNDDGDRVTKELLTNTVEIVTGVHHRVDQAIADLTGTIDLVRAEAEILNADLMCAGTHPFSQWFQQDVTPGSERYETLIDRTRWWGRQMMIWGVHAHVGIEDHRKVLPILNALLTYLPHFQVLSASSPFWVGESTGYASNRAMMFQQLPTAGLPPQFDSYAEYEAMVADMTHTGVIDDFSELRWDVRPSPKWGTLEVRVFDGISSVSEVAGVAALVQCLVDDLSDRLDHGEKLPRMQPWFVRENKWRAARYGMDAIVIQNSEGDERLVTDDTIDLLARLEPAGERLGCQAELQSVRTIIDGGASYQRQLAVAARNEGSLKAVVASLVAELRDGVTTTR
ncbi:MULTISPECIES: glutamate--cysteine ligase [unclassified Frondihabitans]|uniref:glutamate--cysteine ligase n=1 Tax=unclassified Frondihabitans TaxID=2626248 RepID=UPI000F515BB4|nr:MULTISPECIES: glutamate--cysteine ligase [unclassified Frondihabitans]RPE74421.1 carboxylate-amine ligase [Frondihabitans sp. PhB153]RPF02850.1 carboxylate-amine ligase [Frondihabitans sp. PhB161]